MQWSGPRPPVISFERVDHAVHFLVVDRLGSRVVARHVQTILESVDRNHALGAEEKRARDRELSDRTGAPHGDHVAPLDAAHLRAHVPGGKDVRQEEHLIVAESVLDFQRADIGERDARELRLSAREASEHVRVAEQSSGRMTHELLGHPPIWIRVLAQRVRFGTAGGAEAARDREWHHHPITDLEILDAPAHLHDLAHEFMAERCRPFPSWE